MQDYIESLVALGLSFIPFVIALCFVLLVLLSCHKFLLGDKSLSVSEKFPRQLVLTLVYVVCSVALVLSLPIEKDTRNQVLGLLGILLSGVIAFSSTSIVSNIMAGIVFRITNPFRTGDFIRVGSFFGRVTEKGIFDTEIQTEQRELIAFTNSYLLAEPIQAVRSSGTIISANLSLGYELHHKHIEALLLEAAAEADLKEPFVQIIELGDFSISYRVSGLLTEVKSMISSRSKLHASILDTLHEANIEIVSPGFINQRRLDDKPAIIAKSSTSAKVKKPLEGETPTPEDIVFDKAEEAEQKELEEKKLKGRIAEIETALKSASSEHKDKLNESLQNTKLKLEKLVKVKDG